MNCFKTFKGILRIFFNPKYDELSLYSITYCFLLGIIFKFRDFIKLVFPDHTSKEVPQVALVLLISFSIMALNIYHAFSKRKKWEIEKTPMLLFAVLSNCAIAIGAGAVAINHNNIWLYPFPILNILNGIGTLLCAKHGIISENNISDDNVDIQSIIQSIQSTVLLSILFLLCEFRYNLQFIETCSICLAINSIVTNPNLLLIKNIMVTKR